MSFGSRAGRTFPHLSFAGSGQATAVVYCREPEVTDDEWHHFAVMFDRGRDVRVYIDKKLAGMHSMASHRGALKRRLEIGGPYWYLNAAMDELMLFQGTLSREQIELLYDRTRRSEE